MTASRLPLGALVGVVLALATGVATRPAFAEVREAAARVEDEWRRGGAMVSRVPSRFLSDGETLTLALSPSGEPCTTVALIAARGMSFHGRVIDPAEDGEHADHAASVAGVLQLTRCARRPLRRVSVTSDAGRGAIETIFARGATAPPSIGSVLAERTGGTLPPPPEPGALPPLPPPNERADVAQSRAERDGGHLLPRQQWMAGDDGIGEGRATLASGCHRIELFALEPRAGAKGRTFRVDLDAELRGEDAETVLARDRTDAPDARLDICVGVPTATDVVFAGSPPNRPVVLTHATWPIPAQLPLTWGPETGARMAAPMLAHHVANPQSAAVVLAQGPSGMTPISVPVEPGACYLAVAALDHGRGRGIGLRAFAGAEMMADERGTNDEGALVSFCAYGASRVRVEVEARGVGVGWALAVFRVESGLWGAR